MPEIFDLLNKFSIERMLNLVEELDDNVKTQEEYFAKRFFEELVQESRRPSPGN